MATIKEVAGYSRCSGMTGGTDRVVLVVTEKMDEISFLMSVDRPEGTNQVC